MFRKELHFMTPTNKKFKCPLCHRAYTRKGDLKYHFLQKHLAHCPDYPDVVKARSSKCDKPHPCPLDYCHSGYRRKSDLRNHFVMKHPNEVEEYPDMIPNQIILCDVVGCKQSFARRGTLQNHKTSLHQPGQTDWIFPLNTPSKRMRKTDIAFLLNPN